eukprot:scaffold165985_cov21-Prasinocladus_malaysianus.AAC.1
MPGCILFKGTMRPRETKKIQHLFKTVKAKDFVYVSRGPNNSKLPVAPPERILLDSGVQEPQVDSLTNETAMEAWSNSPETLTEATDDGPRQRALRTLKSQGKSQSHGIYLEKACLQKLVATGVLHSVA